MRVLHNIGRALDNAATMLNVATEVAVKAADVAASTLDTANDVVKAAHTAFNTVEPALQSHVEAFALDSYDSAMESIKDTLSHNNFTQSSIARQYLESRGINVPTIESTNS